MSRQININGIDFNETGTRFGISTTWGFILFETNNSISKAPAVHQIASSHNEYFSLGLEYCIPYYESSILILNGAAKNLPDSSSFFKNKNKETSSNKKKFKSKKNFPLSKNMICCWDFKKKQPISRIPVDFSFQNLILSSNHFIFVTEQKLKFTKKKDLLKNEQGRSHNKRNKLTSAKELNTDQLKTSQIKLSKISHCADDLQSTKFSYYDRSTREMIILDINAPNIPNYTITPFSKSQVEYFDFSPDNSRILVASAGFKKIRIIDIVSREKLYDFNGYYHLWDNVSRRKIIWTKLLDLDLVLLGYNDFETMRFMDLRNKQFSLIAESFFVHDFHVGKVEGGKSGRIRGLSMLNPVSSRERDMVPYCRMRKHYWGQKKQKVLRVEIEIYYWDGRVYGLDYDYLGQKMKVAGGKVWLNREQMMEVNPNNRIGSESPDPWIII